MAIHSVRALAKDFIEATIDKWGTDENRVNQILQTVHDNYLTSAFESETAHLLGRIRSQKLLRGKHNIVMAVLKNEMSGSELARAEDIYTIGQEIYRAGRGEYFMEGALSLFDFSSTGSKILGIGTTVGLVGLAVFVPPVAAVVVGALIIGTAVWGAAGIIKNGIEILASDTEIETKENLRDLGASVSTLAVSAPFVPKGMQAVRGGWGVIKTGSITRGHIILARGGLRDFGLRTLGRRGANGAKAGAPLTSSIPPPPRIVRSEAQVQLTGGRVVSKVDDLFRIYTTDHLHPVERIKYIVVERIDGIQVRIGAEAHSHMVLPDERIVGAGHIIGMDRSKQLIVIDGDSSSFATDISGVTVHIRGNHNGLKGVRPAGYCGLARVAEVFTTFFETAVSEVDAEAARASLHFHRP